MWVLEDLHPCFMSVIKSSEYIGISVVAGAAGVHSIFIRFRNFLLRLSSFYFDQNLRIKLFWNCFYLIASQIKVSFNWSISMLAMKYCLNVFHPLIDILNQQCLQGRRKNLKQVPQNFMKVFEIDDVTLTT